MKPGLCVTPNQVLNNLNDLRDLKPDRLLVLLQAPKELKCVEPLSKLEETRVFPVVKMLAQSAVLLAEMCKQSLTTLKTRTVYLIVYNDVTSEADYGTYVKTFLNSVYVLFPDTTFVVCAAASQFLKKNSGACITVEILAELRLLHSFAIMLSDANESMAILEQTRFNTFIEENERVEFILMQINSDKRWDISRVQDFGKPLIFWALSTYREHVYVEPTAPSLTHARPIALITPRRDRISVWQDKELRKSVIRKISKDSSSEFLVAIYSSNQIGELVNGGFVNLSFFEIAYL
jgi:hypothetical protein